MGMGATVPVRQNPKRTKSLENSLSIYLSSLFVFAWPFQFAATEIHPLWGLGPPLPPPTVTVTRGLDGQVYCICKSSEHVCSCLNEHLLA